MSDFAPTTDRASTKLDSAETFAESDVSLSGGAEISGSVSMSTSSNSISSSPNDTDFGTVIEDGGAVINPNEPIRSVTLTAFSDGAQGTYDGAEVKRLSDGAILASVTKAVAAGESATVELPDNLTVGEDYAAYLYSNGTVDSEFQSKDTPLSSTGFDIPSGYVNGEGGTGSVYGVADVSCEYVDPAVTSESVRIEWPYPEDIYAWDTATMQRTEDGETVEVFVEENQTGGWTEVAGPISRGDAIPADPANNVRYRVEFSRTDTSNNPTLDAIYRRIKL